MGSNMEKTALYSFHHSVPCLKKDERALEREIEQTEALLQRTVCHLSRRYPEHLVGAAARENLADLRSHLVDALTLLGEIEERRDLADKELAWRRAFKMLLYAAR